MNISIIATAYQILAWLTLIVSIGAGIILAGNTSEFAIPLLVVLIIFGEIGCITFLAVAEGIMVFIDIEENTRRTAELLRGRD